MASCLGAKRIVMAWAVAALLAAAAPPASPGGPEGPGAALAASPAGAMVVVFKQPTTLAAALGEVVAYGLEASGFTSEYMVPDGSTNTKALPIEPPYRGGPVVRLESQFWHAEWSLVAELVTTRYPPDAAHRALMASHVRRMKRLAPIRGCWDTATCPAVEAVTRVTATGPWQYLRALASSPLVSQVLFDNGWFRAGGGVTYLSGGDVPREAEVLERMLQAVARPVEAYEASPMPPGLGALAHHAPRGYSSWAPTQLYAWWRRDAGREMHPEWDRGRSVLQHMRWATDESRRLYRGRWGESGDTYAYEQRVVFRRIGDAYNEGTWLESNEDRLGGYRCWGRPPTCEAIVWHIGPRYVEWDCTLPGCFAPRLDQPNPSWAVYSAGTNRGDEIMGGRMYLWRIKLLPGEIGGTGAPDVDSGYVEPRLNCQKRLRDIEPRLEWRCRTADGNCTASNHARLLLDGLAAPSGLDPVPPSPPPSTGGELYRMEPVHGSEIVRPCTYGAVES